MEIEFENKGQGLDIWVVECKVLVTGCMTSSWRVLGRIKNNSLVLEWEQILIIPVLGNWMENQIKGHPWLSEFKAM